MDLIDGLEDYVIGKRLHGDSRSQVYTATRLADGRAVVLKVYRQDRSDGRGSRAAREFEALSKAKGAHVPAALELVSGSGPLVLVLEHIPGMALSSWVATGLPSPEAFLRVAIQLCAVLARVHDAHLVHRDVHPANVLVDPETLNCWLIDFGAAETVGSGGPRGHPGAQTEIGALRYVSPEQTGRMNRGIDSRSDLYSLGATLYHALVGRSPFDSDDPLALIHSHMAKLPEAPLAVRPGLPSTLSRIVLKLLQKEPEDRYQTARGLLHDLEACLHQLRCTGRIGDDLSLGDADAPLQLVFTHKLYGRETESQALLSAYASACAGQAQVVLVSGAAGSGKSALLHQLRRPVAKGNGYLASGKFDLYRRDVPYSGWVALLGSFADQVLAENEARLQTWRAELRAALHNIASVLVDLVPDLGAIIGEVAPVPDLGPRETQERLALALKRFLRGAATTAHPLVLFLDDLQWADAGTCRLLASIVEDDCADHMLLVLAYRDEEVPPDHPLRTLLARLSDVPVHVQQIELGPLDLVATSSMLAGVLGRPSADTRRLAETVLRKTGSIPLLVQQFVLHMHGLGLIGFTASHGWTWDDDQLASAGVPEGAVSFLLVKLRRLAPRLRELMEFASCIADEFDVELLSDLSGLARDELEPRLFALIEEGLIAPAPYGFRFTHDRIREAAQALLSDEARSRIHRDTAKHLLRRQGVEGRGTRVFEIADHVNRAGALLSADWRRDAIDCNEAAGTRALRAGAGTAARRYFAAARNLLREEDWSERRSFCLDLILNSAESAFLANEFGEALDLLDQIEQPGLSSLEFGRIAVKRIQVYAMRDAVSESLPYTLSALARVGLRWPMNPSLPRLLLAIAATEWRLWQHRAKLAAGVAPEVDPDPTTRRAPLEIIEASGAIMVRSNALLFALAVCWVVRCQLCHGAVNSAAYGLAGYAAGIALNVQSGRRAARLADVALAWDQRVPHPLYSGRVKLIVYGIIRPFVLPRRAALHPLGEAIDEMLEMGDPEFAYYAINTKLILGMLGGDPLGQAQSELRATEPIRRRIGYRDDETQCILRAVDLLCTPHADSIDWAAATADVEAWLAEHRGCNEPQVRTAWLLLFCVHGRHRLGFENSERIWAKVFSSHVLVHVVDHTFLRGVCASVLAGGAAGGALRRYRRALSDCLRRLHRWARHGPDFVHMAQILTAEQARLRGSGEGARTLYEHAARRALQQNYVHHAALAHERRSGLLVAMGRQTEAEAALTQAALLYRQWGAKGKARALEAELASAPIATLVPRA